MSDFLWWHNVNAKLLGDFVRPPASAMTTLTLPPFIRRAPKEGRHLPQPLHSLLESLPSRLGGLFPHSGNSGVSARPDRFPFHTIVSQIFVCVVAMAQVTAALVGYTGFSIGHPVGNGIAIAAGSSSFGAFPICVWIQLLSFVDMRIVGQESGDFFQNQERVRIPCNSCGLKEGLKVDG